MVNLHIWKISGTLSKMLLDLFLYLRSERIPFPRSVKAQMELFCFINLSSTEAEWMWQMSILFFLGLNYVTEPPACFLAEMQLNYTTSHGSEENQLDKLVSGGRCIMWRTGCLHTGLCGQKGDRQVKASDFALVSPHLGSFVQGRCWHTGASGVESHQDS